jgi:hypothetical protein
MTTVSFRTDKDKQPLTITIDPAEMQRLAKQWHYRLRSRQRWIADQKLWPTIEELAVKDLAAIGLNEPQLEAIAVGSIVEVSINQDPLRADSSTDPASEPEWEARLMPWEYLLTAGTSKYRDEPLVVIRHLKTADSPKARARGKEKRRAAFLQSEPGELRGKYSFQIEKEAIRSYLGDAVDWKDFPANPRLDQIREHVREHAPSIVHVSGIDNFQGTVLLKEHTPVTEIHDGMFLKDSAGKAFQCPAMLVAESITAGKSKPEIVSFNMFNSSARLAAFSVGLGARAAIGFQDVVDDRLAEIFFVNFYLNLRQWKWCILDAYRQTMRELRCYRDKLRGTGIVLWTRESIFKESGKQTPSSKKPRPQSAQAVPASSEWIKFTIKPLDTLNYSILHNSRTPLFERFSVYKFKPLQHPEIDVEVELQMGSDRFPFRHTFEMRDHVLDLSDQITVGLTSEMVRSLREGVRATLFVLITSGRQRFQPNLATVVRPPARQGSIGDNHWGSGIPEGDQGLCFRRVRWLSRQ